MRVAPISAFFLHVMGAMSVVAPDRVLASRGVFPEGTFRGFDVVEVDDSHFCNANVFCLGPDDVIAHADN